MIYEKKVLSTPELDSAAAEIRRLADLANDDSHEWTSENESEWNRVNKRYTALRAEINQNDSPSRNFGRPDASAAPQVSDDFDEFFRNTRTGQDVPVVRSDQSFRAACTRNADQAQLQEQYGTLNIGGLMRAMACGCETDQERRALAEGTDSAGGFTVPSFLSATAIDLLRKKSRIFQAGARTVPLESNENSYAKLASDPAPAWRAENTAVVESDPTFSSVVFAPKSLAVMVKVSEELFQDSVNIQQVLMSSLTQALAKEVDRVALLGAGAGNEPEGVNNFTGINTVSMGTNGAAVTSYAEILDAIQAMQDANAGDTTGAIMSPRTLRTYNGLTDSTGQPLMRPNSISNLPFLETTEVPVDQTQGTAGDASSVFLGDFSSLVIGFRQRLRIEVLREVFSSNLQIGFLAHLRCDVQAWHEQAFARITGIIP